MLLLMPIDDGCEYAGQVAVWLDDVQFAGFDQRRDHGPILGTSVVTRKERVLSLQGDWADRALHAIAIHLDAAIGQEQDQPIPIFGDVLERLIRWGFSGDLAAGVIQWLVRCTCNPDSNLRRDISYPSMKI